MAKLPTVTSPLPRDLQQFVQRVREALDSGGPDAVVTARQLIAAGVVGSSTSGGITPIGGTIETPRAPSGLTASGALASIIVSWNGPQYKGHAYTEIWAHTSDLIGDAVLVGMTAGNNFAHTLGAAATRYYWVRNVNQNGVVSAFNATNGTQGSTGEDPAYLLTVLTDEITSSQLASTLGTRIDLIDAADTVVGSVNERVKIERLARQSSDSTINSAISSEESARQSADAATTSQVNNAISQTQNNAAAVISEQTTRADADAATTSQVNNAISQTQNNAAAVISEQTTRADADAATASQLNGVVSETQTNSAAISSEITARTTATSAVAAQLVGMEATVNNNTAALATELTTRADEDSSVAAQSTGLSAVVSGNTAAIGAESTARSDADSANAAQTTVISSTVNNAQAAIATEATTRATNDTANASQITTLQSSVGGNTASISTQQTAINGLEAQYTVKIDNNGHLSGFGLASNTATSGDVFSEFMVSADRFSIVDPDQPWWNVTKITSGYTSYTKHIHVSQSDWNSYTYVSGDKLVLQSHPTTSGDNKEYAIQGKTTFAGAYFIEVLGATTSEPATFASSAGSARALLKKATTARTPFVVTTSSSTINGVTVPAGVFMDTAMIADATITNAKIGSLTADKITASLLNTVDFYGNTIAGSTIYLGGTITYNTDSDGNNIGIQSVADPKVAMASTGATFAVDAFTIDNPGGTDATPFSVANNVVSIDSALIADGTISNAKIGNTIQSSSYTAGSAGWKIDKTGDAEFNDATFRGTLDVGGSSGSRLTISSTKIEVYDGSTLRVKIGDLS